MRSFLGESPSWSRHRILIPACEGSSPSSPARIFLILLESPFLARLGLFAFWCMGGSWHYHCLCDIQENNLKQQLKAVLLAIATITLAGCASTSTSSVDPVLTVALDAGTQVKTVESIPQPVDCTHRLHCLMLAVHWSSSKPNQAVLWAGWERADAPPIQALEFHARPHAPLRVRSPATRTAHVLPGMVAFQVPIDTLDRIAFSKSAWVRVTTNDGRTHDESVATGDTSSLALDTLKRLMTEVYKDTDKVRYQGLSGLFAAPDEP